MAQLKTTTRVRIATIAVAALALVLAVAPQAQAAGLVNCVEQTHRGACYEFVWVNGVEVRMTFPQAGRPLSHVPNAKVQNFYVIAPQTDTP